jgi:hypothetical protein
LKTQNAILCLLVTVSVKHDVAFRIVTFTGVKPSGLVLIQAPAGKYGIFL